MRLFKIKFFGTCNYTRSVVAASKKSAAFIAYTSALKKGIRANLSSHSSVEVSNG